MILLCTLADWHCRCRYHQMTACIFRKCWCGLCILERYQPVAGEAGCPSSPSYHHRLVSEKRAFHNERTRVWSTANKGVKCPKSPSASFHRAVRGNGRIGHSCCAGRDGEASPGKVNDACIIRGKPFSLTSRLLYCRASAVQSQASELQELEARLQAAEHRRQEVRAISKGGVKETATLLKNCTTPARSTRGPHLIATPLLSGFASLFPSTF